MEHYRSQVLVAFQDVENALGNLRYLSEQADVQERAVGTPGAPCSSARTSTAKAR